MVAAALTGRAARGDNLDAALVINAPKVMSYLREHHCKNVGVLKFRVRKAGHSSSFRTGTINDNIVERLEMALVHVDSEDAPIGVIRDAGAVALANRIPKYDTEPAQKALFGLSYPLVYGDARVRPDLMLTGIIHVPTDLKTVTVDIEAFGPKWDKQEKVASFQVKTDRSLLTDLNESFRVPARSLKRKLRTIELDEESVAEASDTGKGDSSGGNGSASGGAPVDNGGNPNATTGQSSSGQGLLYYEIRYDNQPQTVQPDPNSPKEFMVKEPREGQVVQFLVRSLVPSEKIGLVLMVNGKSTLYEEELDPSQCHAWVLSPNVTYGISGFQVDQNNRKPFRVLSDQDSASVALGPTTGLIQFHIFKRLDNKTENGGGDNSDPPDPNAQAMNISLRGLVSKSAPKARSLAELKKHVQAHIHATSRRAKRGLIVGANGTVAGSIENDELQNQVLVQSIAVRYYKPKAQ
jgi:hypothetical protein